MRFTGAISVGAIVGGYAVRRFGSRPPAFAGLALAAVGFLLMATWNETIADPNLSLHLAIGGLGFGLVIAPLVVSAVDAAHEGYRATAAAWITAARMFGMTAGLAAMSAMGRGLLPIADDQPRDPDTVRRREQRRLRGEGLGIPRQPDRCVV